MNSAGIQVDEKKKLSKQEGTAKYGCLAENEDEKKWTSGEKERIL